MNLLRRAGGLRRLLIIALSIVLICYCIQTVVVSNRSRRISDDNTESAKNIHLYKKHAQPTFESDIYHENTKGIYSKTNFSSITLKSKSEDQCILIVGECPVGQMAYSITTSQEDKAHVCLNGARFLEFDQIADGINLVVLDDNKRIVHDIQYFDFSSNDYHFVEYLGRLPDQFVIFVASYGNIASKFSGNARRTLSNFGSRTISNDFQSGYSFVFVGQKGLQSGWAIEQMHLLNQNNYLKGCLNLPIGSLENSSALTTESFEINLGPVQRDFNVGREVLYCGLSERCAANHIAISVNSGKNKDDEPQICINGKLFMARNLNSAGRGLNIVILNAHSQKVLRVGHFDTYAEDSSTLEVFLEDIVLEEMIIVVTFDEAATKLSNMAKQMFFELGSGLVQNIKFRASWYFIGQKGIKGFTAFEELNYATGSDWAKPIDEKMCVPPLLDGQNVRPDAAVRPRNEAKRHFCQKHDGYEEFCDEIHLDDVITPTPLFNKSMAHNAIFDVPIVVISGLSHNSLRLCLETLIRQPGINADNILVTFDANYQESEELAKLFGVKSESMSSISSYSSQVMLSISRTFDLYPNAVAAIILEEELLVTSDFLYFMSQLFPILKSDQSLRGIAAWNDNGFKTVSTRPDLVYRVESFPGIGFMLTRKTFESYIRNQEACCLLRAWDGWQLSNVSKVSLIPDVSRVFRRSSEGLGVMEKRIEDLLRLPRAYNIESFAAISNTPSLQSEMEYDASLSQLVGKSSTIESSLFAKICKHQRNDGSSIDLFRIDLKSLSSFVLYFERSFTPVNSDFDLTAWQLAKCLGLYHSPHTPTRGWYKGVLRFSYKKKLVFLVASDSPFYKLKPSHYIPAMAYR